MNPKIIVGIPTYKRTHLLQKLLSELVSQPNKKFDLNILVVDNDPDKSASKISAHFPTVKYEFEPVPGVSAVRNRILSNITSEDFLAFIDDDEMPAKNWLNNLFEAIEALKVDAVGGPVVKILPKEAPNWIVRAGFFSDTSKDKFGHTQKLLATGNCLLRVSSLRKHPEISFDLEFGLSGGEDSDYFWHLQQSGFTFGWTDKAVVIEEVLPSRLNLKWLCERYVQIGYVEARLGLRTNHKFWLLMTGLARVSSGLFLTVCNYVKNGQLSNLGFKRFFRGIGAVVASLGFRVQPYKHVG